MRECECKHNGCKDERQWVEEQRMGECESRCDTVGEEGWGWEKWEQEGEWMTGWEREGISNSHKTENTHLLKTYTTTNNH